jgi:hypothetical protein
MHRSMTKDPRLEAIGVSQARSHVPQFPFDRCASVAPGVGRALGRLTGV